MASVLALLLACGSLLGFWRGSSRPGMRRYLSGMELLSAGRPADAEREWRRGAREDPGDWHCYERLGEYYSALLRYEEAADCYSRAAARSSQDGTLFLRLAAVERKLGHRDQAREAARRAAALRPEDADALGLYGILLAESRKRPAALAMLRRAHSLRPRDRQYFMAMVSTELDSLEFAGVERDLAPYLRAHPDDAEACYMMAVVTNQKPRTPENLKADIAVAERALAGMPRDARAHTLLGQLYLDADRPRDALKVYMAGLKVAPYAEGVLRGLMDCYRRLGEPAQVGAVSRAYERVLARHDRISHLTHVMGFDHQNTSAGLELARLVEEDGRLTQARAYYEQLVRQAPQDSRTRQALSDFYLRMKQPELARRALQLSFVP